MSAAEPTAQEIADYIADNYGRCAFGADCRYHYRNEWLGRSCPSWQPTTARTWAELAKAVERPDLNLSPQK